jgi:hypothetical protein
MPRPKRVVASVQKDIAISAPIAAKVDLLLYSELEQRMPYGAWSRLVEALLDRWIKEVQDAERQAR